MLRHQHTGWWPCYAYAGGFDPLPPQFYLWLVIIRQRWLLHTPPDRCRKGKEPIHGVPSPLRKVASSTTCQPIFVTTNYTRSFCYRSRNRMKHVMRQTNGRCGCHGPQPWSGALAWQVYGLTTLEQETKGSPNHAAWSKTRGQCLYVKTLNA